MKMEKNITGEKRNCQCGEVIIFNEVDNKKKIQTSDSKFDFELKKICPKCNIETIYRF